MQTINQDGLTIQIFRYGFGPGYYAEALSQDGQRLAFTGVFRGKGSKQRAIDAAVAQARGNGAGGDTGCPG